jgi:hypothetical protein
MSAICRTLATTSLLLVGSVSCSSADSPPQNESRVVDGNTFPDCPLRNAASVPFGPDAFRTQRVGLFSFGVAAVRLDPGKRELLFLSNGQDLAPQPLVATAAEPDDWPVWYSDNFDFQGRLAVGDIDGNGYPEIAVPVFADKFRYYRGGELHIYQNDAGTLLPEYAQRIKVGGALLEVAFGDADADGDLDLATSILGKDGQLPSAPPSGSGGTIIFENLGGKIASTPFWTSQAAPKCDDGRVNGPCNFVFGMLFADINQDGIMDLVANGDRLRIYQGHLVEKGTPREKTSISAQPVWQSRERWDIGYDLSLGWENWSNRTLNLAVSSYSPLGNRYPFRMYTPEKSDTHTWQSEVNGFGGGLLVHDINNDNYADLITSSQGINKQPVRIFLGSETGYDTAPQFCSGAHSLSSPRSINCVGTLFFGGTIVAAEGDNPIETSCETFVIGETSVQSSTSSGCERTTLNADHAGYVFTLRRKASYITSVKIGGRALDRSLFAFAPGGMTLSVGEKVLPASTVDINYRYSPQPNLVVADMDPLCGPGIFLNQP